MRRCAWRWMQRRELLTVPSATAEEVRSFLCTKGWQAGTGRELKALNVEVVKPGFVASVLFQDQQQPDADTLLRFFSWAQQQEGFVHVAAPYEGMLQVLRSAGKLQDVDWLLERVLSNPHNMTFSLMVSFLETYAEAGQMDKGFRAFMKMCKVHKPSAKVGNAVLDVLIRGADWERAQELIQLMFQWGKPPNDQTFKLLMDAFAASKGDAGLKIYSLFETVIQLGCFPTYGLNRPLLVFICQAAKAEDVYGVCQRMSRISDLVTCNSVMNTFCVCGKSEEAYRFFGLVKEDCNPDDCTYRILVLGLGRGGMLDTAMELFRTMRKVAVVDVKTCNIVVDMLCKSGRVDDGFELVHSMMDTAPQPDTITCNIMLDGLVKAGKLEHALKLWSSMSDTEVFKPDDFTYNILIQGLCGAGRIDEACNYMAGALKRCKVGGVSPDGLYHSFLAGLCKAGKYEHALQVFKKIARPCLITYNTILGACVRSGRMDEAWEIYERMKARNQPRDVFTLNTLIQPLCKGGNVDKALELLEEMKQVKCQGNGITYGYLVDALCKAGRVEEAEALLATGGCTSDVVILTALISGYFRAGRVEDACRVFEGMMMLPSSDSRDRVVPNLVTFNVVIDGLCKAQRLGEADRVLERMKGNGVLPDEFTFNTLMDGHFKAGDCKGAESLFRDMVSSRCSRSGITLNTLVDGFCKSGELSKAISALENASKRSEATVFTYNAVIGKLCKLGRVEEAERLFEGMRLDRGCSPDSVTLTSLIGGLCRKKRVREAYELLKEMMNSEGLNLNVLHFNMVLNGLCKAGDMEEAATLLKRMLEKSVCPDVITFNTLMDGYLKSDKPREGYRVFKEMVQTGCRPDIVSYNTLVGCMCSDGRFQQAYNELLPEMRSKGCCPDTITYNSLLRQCCKEEHRAGEACKIMDEMLSAGFHPAALTCNAFVDYLRKEQSAEDVVSIWIHKLGLRR